jgi:hypothetical protein
MIKLLTLLGFCALLFSCQNRRLYDKYPEECQEYFDYIKEHWSRKSNGFYLIKEVKDTSALWWAHLDDPPHFKQMWDKHLLKCLTTLTRSEVRHLFGKPTDIVRVYNPVKKMKVTRLVYLQSDGKCEEVIRGEYKQHNCNYISFTFWDGKQRPDFNSKPEYFLRN